LGAASIKNKLKSMAKFEELTESKITEDYKLLTKLIRDAVQQALTESDDMNDDGVPYMPGVHKTRLNGAIDYVLSDDKSYVTIYVPFKEEPQMPVAVKVKTAMFDNMLDNGNVTSDEDLQAIDYHDIYRDVQQLFNRPDMQRKYIVE
jgi:hypothetical protein